MKVLLAGGAGRVGTFVTPSLRQRHELRVFDLNPPRHDGVEFVQGSVTDPEAVRRALDGVDTFIYMIMKLGPGRSAENSIPAIIDNYQVNNIGLHLLLFIADELGIKRGVYTSTMTVHHRTRDYYSAEELTPRDSRVIYGLTKGFGEQICEYFCRWFDMNIIALRITQPRERENYLAERRNPADSEAGRPLIRTDEEDLANAYLAALETVQVGHGRFDPIFIAGDEKGETYNLSKARRVLGWEPRSHRYLES